MRGELVNLVNFLRGCPAAFCIFGAKRVKKQINTPLTPYFKFTKFTGSNIYEKLHKKGLIFMNKFIKKRELVNLVNFDILSSFSIEILFAMGVNL